jgi:antirestriction protein ArdC
MPKHVQTPADRQTKRDVYQIVTDCIIHQLEVGVGKPIRPWHDRKLMRPRNADGRFYRGINILILTAAAAEQGYTSGYWATFRLWQEHGAQVKKGEKATWIVFWKVHAEDPENAEDHRYVVARGYPVFNAAQIDSFTLPVEAPEFPVFAANRRAPQIDEFFAKTGSQIVYGGNHAFYRQSTDQIHMPEFGQFHSAADFYSVLGHEHVHWTGAPHRLDRDFTRFDTYAMAMEELVAELGSAFLCAILNIEDYPRPDHAAYLEHWLKLLKMDNRAVFIAAGKAQKAADFLCGVNPAEAAAPKAGQDGIRYQWAAE